MASDPEAKVLGLMMLDISRCCFSESEPVIIEALIFFMPRDLHNMSRRYLVVVQLLDHSIPGTVVGQVFCIQTSFFSHGFHE